jgi:hypothetical protein
MKEMSFLLTVEECLDLGFVDVTYVTHVRCALSRARVTISPACDSGKE